jgi:hypothetical protein
MALVLGAATVLREDLAIYPCTYDADGAVATTLTNGGVGSFTIRNAGGALCPPVAVMTQLDTQIAASVPTGAVVVGNDIVITKSGAGAANGAASSFRLFIFGPKSKGVG